MTCHPPLHLLGPIVCGPADSCSWHCLATWLSIDCAVAPPPVALRPPSDLELLRLKMLEEVEGPFKAKCHTLAKVRPGAGQGGARVASRCASCSI